MLVVGILGLYYACLLCGRRIYGIQPYQNTEDRSALISPQYSLMTADLRCSSDVNRALKKCGFEPKYASFSRVKRVNDDIAF